MRAAAAAQNCPAGAARGSAWPARKATQAAQIAAAPAPAFEAGLVGTAAVVHHAPCGEGRTPAAVVFAAAVEAGAAEEAAGAVEVAAAAAAAVEAAGSVEAAAAVDPAEGAAGAVAMADEMGAAGAAHLCALHTGAVTEGEGPAALGQQEGMQARGAESWEERAAVARHACQQLGWAGRQEARPIPRPAVLAHLGSG